MTVGISEPGKSKKNNLSEEVAQASLFEALRAPVDKNQLASSSVSDSLNRSVGPDYLQKFLLTSISLFLLSHVINSLFPIFKIRAALIKHC